MIPVINLVKLKLYRDNRHVWIAPDNFGVIMEDMEGGQIRGTNVITKTTSYASGDDTVATVSLQYRVEETPDEIQRKISDAVHGPATVAPKAEDILKERQKTNS